MKRCIFVLTAMFFTVSSGAQVIQSVITSAGGNKTNGNASLSWILGETVTPTLKNGDIVLTHGFQQQLILTTIEEKLDAAGIKIFPNPAGEVLNILFQTPVDGEIVLYILDSEGKYLIRDLIGSSMTEKQINLQNIPAGTYFLQLTKGKLVNVYKVVKL